MRLRNPVTIGRTKPIEIKKWLLDKRIRQSDLMKMTGLSDTLVNLVIHGLRNNKKIVDTLLRLGCPPDFLGMEAKAA